MSGYRKSEAREWAREHLQGCSGVLIPSFTADLRALNERAIRHDARHMVGLGYRYALVCAEIAITAEENAQVTRWVREETNGALRLIFHPAWGTLADNIAAVRLAEEAGADLALLSYPPQFWPTTEREILEYTQAFCAATRLGVMLFAIPHWGFERIHPAGMPVALIRELLDRVPNIVAIKAEQGYPLIAGVCEMWHHFAERVVISCPIESDALALMRFIPMQFSGTSNTQWMSDYYPKAFEDARSGRWEQAMTRFWKVHPARLANGAVQGASMPGTQVLNRTAWKYQDWLAGFNGGPLRAPASRIPDRMMAQLRRGLVESGLPVTSDPDSQFSIGRYPA